MRKKTNIRKTILLIEDDAPIIDVYKTAFRRIKGLKLDAITLGNEAISRFKQIDKGKAERPDLVLLDLILPDMNGLLVLEEMRKLKNAKDIPVIILTNYTDEELKKLGYNLKPEEYITKANWPPSELVPYIKEKLEKEELKSKEQKVKSNKK